MREKFPLHRSDSLWPLLREAIAQFLNPSTGEPVKVRAVVIDLIARDLEIRARGSRVRRNASPEIIRDFIVRDCDVLIWIRDFTPVGLARDLWA